MNEFEVPTPKHFQFQLEARDFREEMHFEMWQRRPAVTPLLVLLAVAAMFVIDAFLWYALGLRSGPGIDSGTPIRAIQVLLFVGLMPWVIPIFRAGQHLDVRIEAGGLVVVQDIYEKRWDWFDVRRVDGTENLIILRLPRRKTIILPKRIVGDAKAQNELLEEIGRFRAPAARQPLQGVGAD